MTLAVKHKFTSTIPDGPDAGLVKPSNWNDTHAITGTANVLIGTDNSGNGTEIAAGTNITITGNTISAAGGVGIVNTYAIGAYAMGGYDNNTTASPLVSGGTTTAFLPAHVDDIATGVWNLSSIVATGTWRNMGPTLTNGYWEASPNIGLFLRIS
jgi:hypothetical protein